MKTKTFTVTSEGEIREVSHFERGLNHPEVHAANKTDATKAILARACLMFRHGSPRLRVRDGAFLLVWHNGHEFIAESGTLERASAPLCIGGHKTERDALNDSSFAYYASEAYRSAAGTAQVSQPT